MIKDYQLFMVVGVLLVVDFGIMITWQVSDPFYRATKQLEPYVSAIFVSNSIMIEAKPLGKLEIFFLCFIV